ncbi:MAG TPA: calcium-binding protein [Burkholderiaceae bacterium]
MQAAQCGNGFDGIKLSSLSAVCIGTTTNPLLNGGAVPANSSINATSNEQLVTVYASGAQTVAQTETINVQGTGYYSDLGSNLTPINGAFTVTIPAGQDSVTFGLVNTNTAQQAQTAQVTATLNSDQAVSNTLTVNFPSASSGTPNPTVSLTNLTLGTGTGQVSVNAAKLTGANGSPTADTWTGADGTTYQFAPNASSNIFQGFGTLTVSGGAMAAGEQVTLADFNLATAAGASGYLGLNLQAQYALESTGNANPFNTGGALATASAAGTGATVNFKLYAPSGSQQTRTVYLTLSGADASQYQIGSSAGTVNFTGNTVALTIPAGQTSLALSLNYTGSSKTSQSASLSLSAAQGSPAIESNTLTATDYSTASNGSGSGSGTTNTSNYLISNDTITVTGSNSVVVGNGTRAIIEAGAQNNGGNTAYADTQIPLATALTNTQTQAATSGAGSFLYTQNGNNTLVGGSENDTILTGTGNNLVIMGSGSSTYVGGVDVTSALSGWAVAASDYTYNNGQISSSAVQFAATAAPASNYYGNTFLNSSGLTNAVGGGNDTIYGGAGQNTYVLSNGNNYLDAGSGADTIYSGTGQDTIFAGSGNDVIYGAGGASYINTESGNDTVYLDGGQNTVYGGTGNDTIISGNPTNWAGSFAAESNLIHAGAGNDTIYGAGGNDTIYGGTGTDQLNAGNGNQLIQAGSGNTTINGGSGIDSLVGGAGNDVIYAGNGGTAAAPTTVIGGSGSTAITGGSGVDILDAGNGGTAATPVSIQAGSGATTINGGTGIDNLHGGTGVDVINAGDGGTAAAPTKVFASSGATTVNGGAGVDSISGGSGNDVLNAGNGGTLAAPTTVRGGSSGHDTLVAGQGYASLIGGSGSTNTYQIDAGGGTTTISGTRAGDILVFGPGLTVGNMAGITQASGKTTLSFDDGTSVTVNSTTLTQATFGDGTAATFAQLLSNQFTAGGATESAVNATLPQSSGSTANTLNLYGTADLVGQGNNVNDVIVANAGNDTLIAGTANNTLVGGGASDIYEVSSVSGTVTAINASAGADTLVFAAGTTLPSLSFSTATDSSGNLDVTIQNSQGGEVIVNGALDSIASGGDGSSTMLDTLAFADGSTASLSQLVAQLTTGPTAATASANVTLAGGIQNMALKAANIAATGNGQADVITAGGANDTLIAGTGSDTLSGGGVGNTTYQIGAGSGNVAIVNSSASDTLIFGSGITESDLTTTAATVNGQTVTTITDSQGGTITIQGALANVGFADGSSATLAQLLAPSYTQGSTIYSQVNAAAGSGITTLALTGNANVTGTANGANMTLVSNIGNDTLVAGTGSDTLIGGGATDDYVIAAGSQTTTIENSNMFDALSFGAGVTASDLSASESTVSGAEVITLANSLGGSVNIDVGSGAPVDTILFADGSTASLGAILAQNTSGASAATSAASVTLPGTIQNMQLTGSASITATANALDDVITANTGNDTLVAGAGSDTLVGSGGSTTYDVNSSDGNLAIQNSGAADTLVFDNSLRESDITAASAVVNGQNVVTLTTDLGQTITIAGSLNQVSFADGNTATIAELLAGSYTDSSNATTYSNVSATAGTGITTLALTGSASITGTANAGNDTLDSNSGNDTLVAGSGKDTFVGGAGNTTYSMAAGYGAATIENAGTGDVIAFGAGVSASNLVFSQARASDGSVTLTIYNTQGNTVAIDGYMPGLADTISLAGGQNESIQAILAQSTTGLGAATSAVNVTLPEGIQNMTLTGTANLVARANDEDNVITSNSGNDTLVAGKGYDTLIGGTGATTYVVGAGDGNVTINGSSSQDTLLFDGSMSEADLSATSATVNGQTVVTIANSQGGTITVNGGGLSQLSFADGTATLAQLLSGSYTVGATLYSQVDATAGAGINNIVLTGSADISGTGNNLADTITANSGNDTLIAGTGIDTLIGGAGNDTFVVNNSGDVINEAANSGNNTEDSSVSAVLANNVQNLTGIGAASIRLTGNNLAHNVITANSGNDTLVSGTGIDTLIGGAGNDLFVVTNPATTVVEAPNSGNNTEQTSVSVTLAANVQNLLGFANGNLVLIGNNLNNTITANGANDLLIGGSGADTLNGGAGVDVLQGGSGNDVLNDSVGANAMIAGSGNDSLNGGSGVAFLAGGAGNDAITLGSGMAVVAFNNGDGPAAIATGGGNSDVLSLGGGIDYANLSFSKSGNNLILSTGGNNTITFTNWYSSSANQDFVTLQVIEQAASTYSANSTNTLYNSEVETFSFTQLVADFNSALAANPGLSGWSLSNTLLNDHLSSSNTAALGGDLAYYDGLNGNLTGMNLATAVTTLQNGSFGKTAQTVDAWSGISGATNKLH